MVYDYQVDSQKEFIVKYRTLFQYFEDMRNFIFSNDVENAGHCVNKIGYILNQIKSIIDLKENIATLREVEI